ncbi:MAG: non-canonical purine NTP pyrophosphatase [Planctomycetota bacterium]
MEAASLFIASTNKKKLAELVQLFAGTGVRIVSSADFPELPEVDETGSTFAENAQLKAVSASVYTGLLSLADDSGLEVDALAGAPGVRSARFAATGGGKASDEANRTKLLKELANVSVTNRTARFRCAIAVALRGKVVLQSSGVVEGMIIERERGTGGFGYDSLFVPVGFVKTFAELSPAEKEGQEKEGQSPFHNGDSPPSITGTVPLSHRARALASVKPQLLELMKKENGDCPSF